MRLCDTINILVRAPGEPLQPNLENHWLMKHIHNNISTKS